MFIIHVYLVKLIFVGSKYILMRC